MEKKLDKIINTNGDDHTHLAELLNALPMEESLKEEEGEEGEEEEEEFVSNIKHGHCSIDGGGAHNDNDNVSVIINANVRSKRKKRLASVNSSTRTNTWTKTHINTATHSSVVGNPLVCQIEGCINGDLRKAKKDYHRRHKVCEMHSKAPLVIKAGVAQRFCQQCSRYIHIHIIKSSSITFQCGSSPYCILLGLIFIYNYCNQLLFVYHFVKVVDLYSLT